MSGEITFHLLWMPADPTFGVAEPGFDLWAVRPDESEPMSWIDGVSGGGEDDWREACRVLGIDPDTVRRDDGPVPPPYRSAWVVPADQIGDDDA